MAKASWMKTAAVLAFSLGLVACGNGDDEAPAPETNQSANESVQDSQETMDRAGEETAELARDAGRSGAGGEEAGNDDSANEAETTATGSWENTEDEVDQALKETERRFQEAEKELEEQFKAAEEQDVRSEQELNVQPEEDQ